MPIKHSTRRHRPNQIQAARMQLASGQAAREPPTTCSSSSSWSSSLQPPNENNEQFKSVANNHDDEKMIRWRWRRLIKTTSPGTQAQGQKQHSNQLDNQPPEDPISFQLHPNSVQAATMTDTTRLLDEADPSDMETNQSARWKQDNHRRRHHHHHISPSGEFKLTCSKQQPPAAAARTLVASNTNKKQPRAMTLPAFDCNLRSVVIFSLLMLCLCPGQWAPSVRAVELSEVAVPLIELGQHPSGSFVNLSTVSEASQQQQPGEHDLLLQLLKSTGSLQEANQLIEHLLVADVRSNGAQVPLVEATAVQTDYTQVRAGPAAPPTNLINQDQDRQVSDSNEAPIRVFLEPPPTLGDTSRHISSTTTVNLPTAAPPSTSSTNRLGLLDEIIEASARRANLSSTANLNVHYDDELQQNATHGSSHLAPFPSIGEPLPVSVQRAGKVFASLLQPPAGANSNQTDDGLSNNESVSSLLIGGEHPAQRLIANYSHWINHELPPTSSRRPRLVLKPLTQQALDALRLIEAPSLTQTTPAGLSRSSDVNVVTASIKPTSGGGGAIQANQTTTMRPSRRISDFASLDDEDIDSTSSLHEPIRVKPASKLSSTSSSSPSSSSSSASHVEGNPNQLINPEPDESRIRLGKKNETGLHRIVFINSMPHWTPARMKQTTTTASLSSPVQSRTTAAVLSKRSTTTTTTESYLELKVNADTFKPTTTTESPSSGPPTQLYSIETYETPTTARVNLKSTTKRPKQKSGRRKSSSPGRHPSNSTTATTKKKRLKKFKTTTATLLLSETTPRVRIMSSAMLEIAPTLMVNPTTAATPTTPTTPAPATTTTTTTTSEPTLGTTESSSTATTRGAKSLNFANMFLGTTNFDFIMANGQQTKQVEERRPTLSAFADYPQTTLTGSETTARPPVAIHLLPEDVPAPTPDSLSVSADQDRLSRWRAVELPLREHSEERIQRRKARPQVSPSQVSPSQVSSSQVSSSQPADQDTMVASSTEPSIRRSTVTSTMSTNLAPTMTSPFAEDSTDYSQPQVVVLPTTLSAFEPTQPNIEPDLQTTIAGASTTSTTTTTGLPHNHRYPSSSTTGDDKHRYHNHRQIENANRSPLQAKPSARPRFVSSKINQVVKANLAERAELENNNSNHNSGSDYSLISRPTSGNSTGQYGKRLSEQADQFARSLQSTGVNRAELQVKWTPTSSFDELPTSSTAGVAISDQSAASDVGGPSGGRPFNPSNEGQAQLDATESVSSTPAPDHEITWPATATATNEISTSEPSGDSNTLGPLVYSQPSGRPASGDLRQVAASGNQLGMAPYLLETTTPTTSSTTTTTAAPRVLSMISADDPLPSILAHNRLSSIFQYKLANRTSTGRPASSNQQVVLLQQNNQADQRPPVSRANASEQANDAALSQMVSRLIQLASNNKGGRESWPLAESSKVNSTRDANEETSTTTTTTTTGESNLGLYGPFYSATKDTTNMSSSLLDNKRDSSVIPPTTTMTTQMTTTTMMTTSTPAINKQTFRHANRLLRRDKQRAPAATGKPGATIESSPNDAHRQSPKRLQEENADRAETSIAERDSLHGDLIDDTIEGQQQQHRQHRQQQQKPNDSIGVRENKLQELQRNKSSSSSASNAFSHVHGINLQTAGAADATFVSDVPSKQTNATTSAESANNAESANFAKAPAEETDPDTNEDVGGLPEVYIRPAVQREQPSPNRWTPDEIPGEQVRAPNDKRKRRRQPPVLATTEGSSTSEMPAELNLDEINHNSSLGSLFARLPLAQLNETHLVSQDGDIMQSMSPSAKRRRDLKKKAKHTAVAAATTMITPTAPTAGQDEAMVTDGSQDWRTSSLSPLVDDYRAKALLKTMINLGVPGSGGSANGTPTSGLDDYFGGSSTSSMDNQPDVATTPASTTTEPNRRFKSNVFGRERTPVRVVRVEKIRNRNQQQLIDQQLRRQQQQQLQHSTEQPPEQTSTSTVRPPPQPPQTTTGKSEWHRRVATTDKPRRRPFLAPKLTTSLTNNSLVAVTTTTMASVPSTTTTTTTNINQTEATWRPPVVDPTTSKSTEATEQSVTMGPGDAVFVSDQYDDQASDRKSTTVTFVDPSWPQSTSSSSTTSSTTSRPEEDVLRESSGNFEFVDFKQPISTSTTTSTTTTSARPDLSYRAPLAEQAADLNQGVQTRLTAHSPPRNQRHQPNFPVDSGGTFQVVAKANNITSLGSYNSTSLGGHLESFSKLSPMQRVTVLAIGGGCTLIVVSLLLIALLIKCKSVMNHRRAARSRRRREKRRALINLAGGGGGARSRSLGVFERSGKPRSATKQAKNKNTKRARSSGPLLLATGSSELSRDDNQVCSSAASTTSAGMSTSSDGLNYVDINSKLTDKILAKQGRQRAPGKADNLQHIIGGSASIPNLLETRNKTTNAMHWAQQSNNNNNNHLHQQQQHPPVAMGYEKSTLKQRISGTITSRLLRLHLPRLLPYFALDAYAEQANRMRQPNSQHYPAPVQQRDPLVMGDLLNIHSRPAAPMPLVNPGQPEQQARQQQQHNFHLSSKYSIGGPQQHQTPLTRPKQKQKRCTAKTAKQLASGQRVPSCQCASCSNLWLFNGADQMANNNQTTHQIRPPVTMPSSAPAASGQPQVNTGMIYNPIPSRGKLPFGTASSVLRDHSSSHHNLAAVPPVPPVRIAGTLMSNRPFNMAGRHLIGDLGPDNVSVQHSQTYNEHHLLIDNLPSSSNYQRQSEMHQNNHQDAAYRSHHQLNHLMEEEQQQQQDDEDDRQQQHHQRRQRDGMQPENQTHVEEDDEDDEDDQGASESDNYYNLDHTYDGHPTFEVDSKQSQAGQRQTGNLAQENQQQARSQQQHQQQHKNPTRQPLGSNCNCNLVLYPL